LLPSFYAAGPSGKVVISRHRVLPLASPTTGSSGVSGMLWIRGSITSALEYWITGFRG
jgi:hypothetical protein